MDMGRMIRTARKKCGLTQVELAEVLGVTHGAIAGWEAGRRMPDPKMLKRLAECLGVSVDYLLDHAGGEELGVDIAAAIGGLVETVEKGGAMVDGDELASSAADVAVLMLRGTLAATRSAQRDAVLKGGAEHGKE